MIKRLKSWVPSPVKSTLRTAIGLIKNDYIFLPKKQVTYAHDHLYTLHNADFLKDPLFKESYELGKKTDESLLLADIDIEWRIHVLCWAARHATHLEGDFVDCGVHTGIFARAIINYVDFAKTGKKYYLLDTFTGLSERFSTPEELKKNKTLHYDRRGDIYQKVQETFRGFNVRIIKGAVPETLDQVDSDRICYLSIDMNCVQPEVDALNYFWDKMTSGGIILLDDYGYLDATRDQRAAHDKFAASKGVEILSLPTCQGLIIKP